RDLMRQIAEGTWICGDPGMQFDTTINDWHTSPNTARINASNPCSEYMFLDDTACNLSSINLMKFVKEDGEFDVVAFEKACRTMILAQEILVDNASYPTPAIEKNSHAFRPLGLGYANLGALLMSRGLPYDSGGGMMKIVNQTVPMALKKLGYNPQQVKEVIEYIDENETIEGAPHVKEPHQAVFDCAFKPMRGTRSIHYMGHIKMMGATQPFLS